MSVRYSKSFDYVFSNQIQNYSIFMLRNKRVGNCSPIFKFSKFENCNNFLKKFRKLIVKYQLSENAMKRTSLKKN